MATTTVYLSGEASWCKLTQNKLDTKFRPNWSLSVALDPASLNAFKEAKIGVELREDDQGLKRVANFRRYADVDYKDSERRSTKLPPRVLSEENVLYGGVIGNGSEVTVKLDVFDTKYPRKGHRLVSVKINKLIPYEPEDGDNPLDDPLPDDQIPF